MRHVEQLYPVFALAGWTALVLLLVRIARVRAGLRREIAVDDFRYGESASVPPGVSLSNRNLMNLLELPVQFYLVALMLHVNAGVSFTRSRWRGPASRSGSFTARSI